MSLLRTLKYFFYRSSGNEITLKELNEMILRNQKMVLIDVRSPQEYKEGHLQNAISIPLYELGHQVSKKVANKEELIVVYCQRGSRSKKALKILNSLGYVNVYEVRGGLEG